MGRATALEAGAAGVEISATGRCGRAQTPYYPTRDPTRWAEHARRRQRCHVPTVVPCGQVRWPCQPAWEGRPRVDIAGHGRIITRIACRCWHRIPNQRSPAGNRRTSVRHVNPVPDLIDIPAVAGLAAARRMSALRPHLVSSLSFPSTGPCGPMFPDFPHCRKVENPA